MPSARATTLNGRPDGAASPGKALPAPARKRRVDGVLLLDKPAGPSSNAVLQHVKRLLAARKAGHAGTLDPLATGLLPLLFGEATKFAAYLSDAHKTYEATLLLGVSTSTGDLAGEILGRRVVDVSAEAVESTVARFRGAILQTPPMHSALKQSGTPLYELARRGEVVPRAPRAVFIDELTIVRLARDEVDIRVRCSKGTYIRVLGEDIGSALGCGATLKGLRRVAVGGFEVGHAVSVEAFDAASGAQRIGMLLPVDAGLAHLPALELPPENTVLLRMGRRVHLAQHVAPGDEVARLYDAETREFLGLGEVSQGWVQPIRLVAAAEDENDLRQQRPTR